MKIPILSGVDNEVIATKTQDINKTQDDVNFKLRVHKTTIVWKSITNYSRGIRHSFEYTFSHVVIDLQGCVLYQGLRLLPQLLRLLTQPYATYILRVPVNLIKYYVNRQEVKEVLEAIAKIT